MEAMELRGELKSHYWGKIGRHSEAGLFYWQSTKRDLLDENQTYSTVLFSGSSTSKTIFVNLYMPLYLFIKHQPQALGLECAKRFNNKLPFKVKILSLNKSMALLCHPNKEHAERLHKLYPRRYLDAGHKPTMIIALKYMEVLVGFRKRDEIESFLSAIPELAICVPYEKIENFLCSGKQRHLRDIVLYILNATELEIKLTIEILFQRFENADNGTKSALYFNVLEKLYAQHKYDSGIFAPFFLNHIILKPGQAIYIPPGVPNTYITGDCLEVSTYSRTVIRCGLTRKYTDIEEFMNIADFTPHSADKLSLEPIPVDVFMTAYQAPVAEYAVNRIAIPKNLSYELPVYESCSLLIVTRGQGSLADYRSIGIGKTLFVLPNERVKIASKTDMTMYSIYPNIRFVPKTFGAIA